MYKLFTECANNEIQQGLTMLWNTNIPILERSYPIWTWSLSSILLWLKNKEHHMVCYHNLFISLEIRVKYVPPNFMKPTAEMHVGNVTRISWVSLTSSFHNWESYLLNLFWSASYRYFIFSLMYLREILQTLPRHLKWSYCHFDAFFCLLQKKITLIQHTIFTLK